MLLSALHELSDDLMLGIALRGLVQQICCFPWSVRPRTHHADPLVPGRTHARCFTPTRSPRMAIVCVVKSEPQNPELFSGHKLEHLVWPAAKVRASFGMATESDGLRACNEARLPFLGILDSEFWESGPSRDQ